MPPVTNAVAEVLSRAANRVRGWLEHRLDQDAVDIARLYRAGRNVLVERLRNAYEVYLADDPTFVRARTTVAAQALDRAIAQSVDELTESIGRQSVDYLSRIMGGQRSAVNRAIGRTFGRSLADLPISTQTVLNELTTSTIGGGTFFDRVFAAGDDLKRQLVGNVRTSLLNGDDFETLRRRVQRTFGVDRLVDPGTSARGVSQAYRNEARREWNALMGGVAREQGALEVWWAMLDNRTTPGCAARHGRALNEIGDRPPRHYNCRCTIALFPGETDLEEYRAQADSWLSSRGYSRRRASFMESDVEEAWDETKHKRVSKGRPGGGRFTSKGPTPANFGRMNQSDFSGGTSGPPGQFMYHTSSKSNFYDIAGDRLRPKTPSYRQEQDFWPNGGREPRVYFSTRPAGALSFSEPDGILLRVSTRRLQGAGLRTEFKDQDYYLSRKSISPRVIQYLGSDGKWHPVRSVLSEGWAWGQETMQPAPLVNAPPTGKVQCASIPWHRVPALLQGSEVPSWTDYDRAKAVAHPDHVLVAKNADRLQVAMASGWRQLALTESGVWVPVPGGRALDAPDGPSWSRPRRRLPLTVIERWPAMKTVTFPAARDGEQYAATFLSSITAGRIARGERFEDEWPAGGNLAALVDLALAKGVGMVGQVFVVARVPYVPHAAVAHVGSRDVDVAVDFVTGRVFYSREDFGPQEGLVPYTRVAVAALEPGDRVWAIRPRGLSIWSFPGGHVDPGEDYVQAATREMREEAGLDVEIVRPLGTLYRPWSNTVLYLGRRRGGLGLVRTPDEIDAIALVKIDQLAEDERYFLEHAIYKESITVPVVSSVLVEAEAKPWDESKYKRAKKGTDTGGQFVSKGGGGGDAAMRDAMLRRDKKRSASLKKKQRGVFAPVLRSSGGFTTTYHGTGSKHLKSILKNGLSGKFEHGLDTLYRGYKRAKYQPVFVAARQEDAQYFASSHALKSGQDMAVFKIQIPKSQTEFLLRDPASTPVGWKFAGTIPPSWIKAAWVARGGSRVEATWKRKASESEDEGTTLYVVHPLLSEFSESSSVPLVRAQLVSEVEEARRKQWDESKYKRAKKGTDTGGQFVSKGGGGTGKVAPSKTEFPDRDVLDSLRSKADKSRYLVTRLPNPNYVGASKRSLNVGKHMTGTVIAENAAVAFLRSQGIKDAKLLKPGGRNNYAVDLLYNVNSRPTLVEVKGGFIGATPRAHQWRLTTGEPSAREKVMFAKWSPEERRRYSETVQKKRLFANKDRAATQIQRLTGKPVQRETITMVVDPKGKGKGVVDVYRFKGWHQRIGWNSAEAKKAYVGTFQYREQAS